MDQHSGNPCMDSNCVAKSDLNERPPYTCDDIVSANETSCNLPGLCDGSGAYCYEWGTSASVCIKGEVRPCHETPYNIFTAETCTMTGESTINCTALSPAPEPINVSIGVNNISNPFSDFITREYYSYGSSCSGLDYRGKEAVFNLPTTCTGKQATITVSNAATDMIVLHLTNYKDPTTCQAQGTNTLTVANWNANDKIIIETDPGDPIIFDLIVTCP